MSARDSAWTSGDAGTRSERHGSPDSVRWYRGKNCSSDMLVDPKRGLDEDGGGVNAGWRGGWWWCLSLSPSLGINAYSRARPLMPADCTWQVTGLSTNQRSSMIGRKGMICDSLLASSSSSKYHLFTDQFSIAAFTGSSISIFMIDGSALCRIYDYSGTFISRQANQPQSGHHGPFLIA